MQATSSQRGSQVVSPYALTPEPEVNRQRIVEVTPQHNVRIKKDGERCLKDAIPGGTVCAKHGGNAPQVPREGNSALPHTVADLHEVDRVDHGARNGAVRVGERRQRQRAPCRIERAP